MDHLADYVDCALRAGTTAHQSLIARRVSEVDLIACASPRCVEIFGKPQGPKDLKNDHYSVSSLFH